MKKTTAKKVSSRRYGFLLTALVIVFVIASGFYFLTTGVRSAKRVEQTLIDRFDWVDEYTPAISGFIEPQRIEAFIRVREAVQPGCVDYQAVLTSIGELEKLDSDQEKPASEATSTGFQAMKSAFSAGPRMMEFSTTRNQALLAEEMGLGEYFYIYLTTYGKQLADEANSDFSATEEAYISDRAREEFTQILTNQLQALRASESKASYPELETSLQMEIDALKDGTHTSAWPNGPIGKARESLAPYQARLAELYCSGIVQIELLQKNRGFDFDG
ncbi:MAG: hypothetical protein WBN41_06595 [Lysobacterales bacterium]